MKKVLLFACVATALAACESAQDSDQISANTPAPEAASPTATTSVEAPPNQPTDGSRRANDSLDIAGFDQSTRPQDDFFRHVNGGWLDNTEMPADKTRWGSFDMLAEQSREAVKSIIDDLAATENLPSGSDSQKVRDLFLSYMDEDTINQLGAQPLQPAMDSIASLRTPSDLARFLGSLSKAGVNLPVNFIRTPRILNPISSISIKVASGYPIAIITSTIASVASRSLRPIKLT